MKRLALIAAAIAIAAPAMAQTNWTSSQVGPFTHYNGTDAHGGQWTGSSSQTGPFTHYNFQGPNGQTTNCTTSQVGQFAHTTCQ